MSLCSGSAVAQEVESRPVTGGLPVQNCVPLIVPVGIDLRAWWH